MKTCNVREVCRCPKCGAAIKVGWSINCSSLPDGGVHEHVGEIWTVIAGCEHLAITGGNRNTPFPNPLNQRDWTRQ